MRIFLITLLLNFSIILFGQTKKIKIAVSNVQECIKTPYTLVFSDEFDGASLDTS